MPSPNPISFEREITKARIVAEIETIESEINSGGFISEVGIRKLRDLRIALELKPVVGSV